MRIKIARMGSQAAEKRATGNYLHGFFSMHPSPEAHFMAGR
jgi:hypothetical protein